MALRRLISSDTCTASSLVGHRMRSRREPTGLYPLDYWDPERGGLTRSRLGLGDDILPLQQKWYRAHLDRRRFRPPHTLYGLHHRFGYL